jgi:hypothetical protein
MRLFHTYIQVKEETEEARLTQAHDPASAPIPFENKMLAFNALKIGLKYSYENWRMWTNYMLVAMDVGEFAEGSRALGRVVEERAAKVGAECVDEDVLDRLIDAVIRAPIKGSTNGDESLSVAAQDGDTSARTPNEGEGLRPRVLDLLERVILPRLSSQRIFRGYARLVASQQRWADAIKYYMDAYRSGRAATIEKGAEISKDQWLNACDEVEEIVDVLRNFGPRAEEQEREEKAHARGKGDRDGDQRLDEPDTISSGRWKMQARSIVRTFMARTRDLFEDDPDWSKLNELMNELKH